MPRQIRRSIVFAMKLTAPSQVSKLTPPGWPLLAERADFPGGKWHDRDWGGATCW
jgi:hypothetical protein